MHRGECSSCPSGIRKTAVFQNTRTTSDFFARNPDSDKSRERTARHLHCDGHHPHITYVLSTHEVTCKYAPRGHLEFQTTPKPDSIRLPPYQRHVSVLAVTTSRASTLGISRRIQLPDKKMAALFVTYATTNITVTA